MIEPLYLMIILHYDISFMFFHDITYFFTIGEIRFETVDLTTRLLIPIIVLQNHNRYNIMDKGHNYSIDVTAIEAEVNCFL